MRDLLRKWGFECRRGVAAAGEPDIVHDVPGVHIESKNTERLDLWGAIAQAEKDAGKLEPVVFFRRNNTHIRVICGADEYLRLKRLESIVNEFRELV